MKQNLTWATTQAVALAAVFLICLSGTKSSAATSVLDLGLKGDGQTDDTDALQKALAAGQVELHFPRGTYLLGTLELPSDTSLHFASTARVKIISAKIRKFSDENARDAVRPLFLLKGDRIVIEGLDAQGVFETSSKESHDQEQLTVNYLVYGEGCADLTFDRLRVVLGQKKQEKAPTLICIKQCKNVVFADSEIEKIYHGIEAVGCWNVSVHGNRAIQCETLTTFTRGEGLRHYDNWSRQVTYQCVFRGGSPDPSRKAPAVPLGSSTTVIRGLDSKQEGYSPHLAGTYDIQIANNYAEYGRTLAWGNKGREVIFEGNICRFTTDYAYGTEGCENVTFANNIAINAKSVGIMTMYWSEKVVVTGNTVIVRDEPYNPEFGKYPEQNQYWGGLLRFHHGSTTKEDTAAGSLYGAGKVIVSGNLLVNELHDQLRGVVIESGRDIFISGNKIINGWVRKTGEGDLVMIGNEFDSDLPAQHGVVGLGSGVGEAIIKDNVMRFNGGKSAVTKGRQLMPNDDEAEPVREEEKLIAALPAIDNTAGAKTMRMLLVEGNIIEGWTGEVIRLAAVNRKTEPIRFIVRGNSLEGTIGIMGSPEAYRCAITNNINVKTLEPIQLITK